MRIETFFEKVDQLVDAPNAVAKMRELVLQLAVQGRLVSQDASDEPAAELVKKIRMEKARRHSRPESDNEILTVEDNDFLFSIPDSWEWVGATFPALMVSDFGKKVQTKEVIDEGLYPVVDQGKVFIRGYCNDPNRVIHVSEPIILFGDHTRETKFIDFDFVVGADGVKLLQPLCLDPLYYYLALRWLPLNSRGYGRHFKLLRAAVIPLPPLAEQARIVAKVNELMTVCDRLEALLQERDTMQASLTRASLARFADAPAPADLNFLFHDSYTIGPADFRKTVLNLAVQGKLVPQDPNDEPAETLNASLPSSLRAIADQVGARFALPTERIENGDDLPTGWGIAQLQSIGITQTGTTPSKSQPHFTGSYIPFIKPGDIDGDNIDYENEGLSADGLNAGRLIPKGSVIMVSIGGSIGKTAIVDRNVSCNQQINSVTPAECVEPRFVLSAIRSRGFQEEVMSRAAQSTLPIISKSKWETIRIPIPPLAEQRRIVAKVDQLMALVDRLEAQLAASRATATSLMNAVVAELTAEV
jgi:type I restriction enzyme, S subunit